MAHASRSEAVGTGVAAPSLRQLLTHAQHRALHLEMRDHYGGSPIYAAWREGRSYDRAPADAEWVAIMAPLRSRGGDLRRARIVSEPVSSFIRYEYESTDVAAIAAGETVRWLPRRRASDLALPGNDFWLVDDDLLFLHFSGDGVLVDTEILNSPQAVNLCESAFEAVWSRAVDHADYVPA